MADYPCDAHRARYPGASHRFYVNVYRDEDKLQFKGSICAQCLETVLDELRAWALSWDGQGWAFPETDEPPATESLWRPSDRGVAALNGSRRF